MAKKKIAREDFAGLRLLRPSASLEKGNSRRSASRAFKEGYYDSYYNEYVYEGGYKDEVVCYGYRDSGGGEWSSGIPPWGEDDNPFIDRDNPGYEGDIWFEIYGEDYYYYNSPYYDVYDTEVGGGHNPQKDGVDVTNADHFFFENTKDNPAFHKQLTKILESNSMLKELLTYFDRGYSAMILRMEEMPPDTGAITEYDEKRKLMVMTFNTGCMNSDGWYFRPTEKDKNGDWDNIGFDWDKVYTKDEYLLVTLVHEALHARHFAIYYDTYNEIQKEKGFGNEVKGTDVYERLRKQGYSEDFINIFVTPGKVLRFAGREALMHEFIRKYDLWIFDDALTEYRNDF